MSAESLRSILTLWASAYLGCALWLLGGLLPDGSISMPLLAQLSWLALIGSFPIALALGAASRVSRGSRSMLVVSTVAVLALALVIGWEHSDFLLSGPHWILHARRGLARAAISSAIAIFAAGAWVWLALGARVRSGFRLGAWAAGSLAALVLMTAAMVRYRAYDYSMAQLVFPASVLAGALLRLLASLSRHRLWLLGTALLCLVYGASSRLDPDLVATGQRQMLAQSRAGTLAALYILPPIRRTDTWSSDGQPCPRPGARIEGSSPDIGPEHRSNVIIITVDALRKDVIGAEAGGRPVTPELVRLARSGVSFSNATSTYPATLFAIGSAFTGLSPAELYLSPSLPETIFTLSRATVDQRLAVLPDVSWFRLPIVGQFLTRDVTTTFATSDAGATDALIARLRAARDQRDSVIAWIHYYAPHHPYRSHRSLPMGRGRKNAYLSEVAYFDRELGRLMRYLEDEDWLSDTLVVFFADHGEALGEKSYWGHHVYLNAWMIDVPLILRHAALRPTAPTVGVSLADVAPTVLHFLGVPIPSDLVAKSLFTLDPDLPDRPTFSAAFPVRGRELFDSFRLPALDDATIRARLRRIRVASKGYEPKVAITEEPYRLIEHRAADASIFYDHLRDPDERSDHGASHSAARERLARELEHWEQEQLHRIQCRLQLSEPVPAPARP